jgi:hypothetical protein
MAQRGDEYPRPAGDDPWWADAWEIDFADGGAGIGGFVRLTLLPNQRIAWWWTGLLTPRLVAVRDHEVPLPRAGLEIRADGLWGELVCETPLEHWSVGLEAFGIAYDDPAEAWGDEWGDRLPVGLALDWEATAPAGDVPPTGPAPAGPLAVGYAQPGRVHGEILVGSDTRIGFGGLGFRSRASGVLDWWSGRPHGRLAWVTAAGGGHEDASRAAEDLGRAPLLVTGPGRPTVRLDRALCRLDEPGRPAGWRERFPG